MEEIKSKEVCGLGSVATFAIANALRSQSNNEQSAHISKDEV